MNSKFTREIFADVFPQLKDRNPKVVYPCVNEADVANDKNDAQRYELWKGKKVILSINRFERKKAVELALHAFAGLPQETRQAARLVIAGSSPRSHLDTAASYRVSAGGYDPRMSENVQCHQELDSLALSLGLRPGTANNLVTALSIPPDINVLFLLSVPSSLKSTLLQSASLLVYTPKFEHFGIVPLEAMLARVPVLAAKTGGPKETVVDEETGWLRNADEDAEWTKVMDLVLNRLDEANLKGMGDKGRKRVMEEFSQKSMALNLDETIKEMHAATQRPRVLGTAILATGALVIGIAAGIAWQLYR